MGSVGWSGPPGERGAEGPEDPEGQNYGGNTPIIPEATIDRLRVLPGMQHTREQVYQAIDSERQYQLVAAPCGKKSLGDYLTLLQHYLIKAQADWCELHELAHQEALDELRKIAAIAVAGMEEHGAPLRVVEPAATPIALGG